MSRKFIFAFCLLSLSFFSFRTVQAAVVINEVELSPTTERFIELYNSGDASVDLTNWYIQRKTATGSTFGSLVSKTNFQGKTIPAHGYFLISRVSLSNSDIVVDNLTLTDSNTIQIKSGSEDVVDKVGWGSASDCASPCPPNPAEGQSLGKDSSGSWVLGTPTPKSENQTQNPAGGGSTPSGSNDNTNTGTAGTTDTGTTSGANTSVGASSAKNEPEKIKVKIISKSMVFVGIPFALHGEVTGIDKNSYYGKYFWNFGDGSSTEAKDNLAFTHTYPYPGEYTISFEYYSNSYSDTPDASARVTVKAVPASVSISRVGTGSDFFIELSNDATYDIDISNWVVSSPDKKFTLPKNTIISSKKKITLSPTITSFTLADAPNLKLFNSAGGLVFDHSSLAKSQEKIPVPVVTVAKTKEKEIKKDIEEIKPELRAAVIESSFPYFSVIGSVVFIGGSAGAAYFIRRRKISTKEGEDFKILDK